MKNIFKFQLWHLLSVMALIYAIKLFIDTYPETLSGSLSGVSSYCWFWIAMIVPIAHQVYVWLIWRYELYKKTFSSIYGVQKAFKLYAVGFSILFVGRLIAIILLAISNQGSLLINASFAYFLSALITPFVIYLFYSVKKYFTIERAFGIDHFNKDYSEPYVKKGIFKYTNNGMYLFGLMVLYLPGLLLLSQAALIVALFNHIYIWVHYYCTERPDMIEIYGTVPEN